MKKTILLLTLSIATSVFAQEVDYFRDGIPAVKYYKTNNKLDSVHTFYHNGKPKEFVHFNKNGRLDGKSHRLDKKGNIVTTWAYKNGRCINEQLFFAEDYFRSHRLKHYQKVTQQLNAFDSNKKLPIKLFFKKAYNDTWMGNNFVALQELKTLEKIYLKSNSPKKEETLSRIYELFRINYSRLEKMDHAAEYGLKAIKSAPEHGRMLYHYAVFLYQNKDFRLSEEYAKRALKTKTKNVFAFANRLLALINTQLENYEVAKSYIDKALAEKAGLEKYSVKKPERDIDVLNAFVNHKLGDVNGVTQLENIVQNEPENSYALRDLGEVYYDLEAFDKACDVLSLAESLDYEKIYDNDDLQFFKDNSCQQNEEQVSKKFISFSQKTYISPNPAVDVIQIVNYDKFKFKYEIHNFNKAHVASGQTKNGSIDVSDLSAGYYILSILDGKESIHLKLIKE